MDMNNEMDDLFRKAGEDYPLNLGKPDWDAVAGKLHTDTGDLGPGFGMAAAAPRKRRRYQWLLLLLLPLGIYGLMELAGGRAIPATGRPQTADGTRFADGTREADGGPQTAAGKLAVGAADLKNTKQVKEPSAGSPRNTSVIQGENEKQENENPKKTRTGLTGTASANPVLNQSVAENANGNDRKTASVKSPGHQQDISDRKNADTEVPGSTGIGHPTTNGKSGHRSSAENGNPPVSELPVTGGSPGTGEDGLAANGRNEANEPSADAPSLADQVMAGMAGNPSARDSNHVSKDGSTPVVTNTKTAEKKDKKAPIHPSIKQQRGFYAGVTAAPDFSTVKFQSMKSTGYSFGVVGGYRISSHFSVETGLSWDRKKYYSSGEYFNKSKTQIPASVKVNYIDGYCEMFEIPVTVRYDLTTGKKGRWFAAAGFSSYLMKNENYLYGATSNNVNWSRYVDYKNSGNNFFSIAEFSLGYEYFLNARNGIRVEPYFKTPISGVGIGSLPITSVGITFGLIHSFH